MSSVILAFITLTVIRGRISVHAPAPHTTLSWTTMLHAHTHTELSRSVQLDIGDAAVLLRRLENTTAAADDNDEEVVRRVSKQLNNALRAFQQSRCRTPGVDFTDTGAWCQRAVRDLHLFDRGLAKTLALFLAGTSVLSLGDGTGVYRQLILNTSKVWFVLGFCFPSQHNVN